MRKILNDIDKVVAESAISRVEECGIVGAGGAGFPTAAKLRSRVSTVIANAAECEPLLHKDKELLQHHAEPFLRGLRLAMEMAGAREGVIGIKEKYHEIIAELERQEPAWVRVVPLPDVHLAMALGGKGFVLMAGDGASVQTAVAAGSKAAAEDGMLVGRGVIAAPSPELFREYV